LQADLTPVRRAVICTLFFVSGIVTLVQTFFGDRLPIIQARSAARRSLGACVLGACSSLLGHGTRALRRPLWRRQPGRVALAHPAPGHRNPQKPQQETRVHGRRPLEGWVSAAGGMAGESRSACLAGRPGARGPTLACARAQGGSFAYLTPAFAIIAEVKARGGWPADDADGNNHARFLVRRPQHAALACGNGAGHQ
jgi:hypothetical protein